MSIAPLENMTLAAPEERTQVYQDFNVAKVQIERPKGFPVELDDFNPLCKPHQKVIGQWAVANGPVLVAAKFGLGKSIIQMESMRLLMEKTGSERSIITLPLNVAREFKRDAYLLRTGDGPGITDAQRKELREWIEDKKPALFDPIFIQRQEDVRGPGLYLTNFESVRERKVDPTKIGPSSLDEAAILRAMGGSKTFREFMRLFEYSDHIRQAFTAIPTPQEIIEILSYAAYLGIADVGLIKTKYFRRNSEKADELTLLPSMVRPFWLWVSSWACLIRKPSDLGFSDEGYELPKLDLRWHCIPTDHTTAECDRGGQGRLLKSTKLGVVGASREKRASLDARVAKVMEIRAEDPDAHRIIWHDLEDERKALEKAIPNLATIHGNTSVQPLDTREGIIADFSDGKIQELGAKPVMAGSGCNFQRHCWWEIFTGIGFKANEMLQAIHRVQRFLQTHPVRIDFIYTEAEEGIKEEFLRRWAQYDEMGEMMAQIIDEFGLNADLKAKSLGRELGVDRRELEGVGWRMVNNDCVLEAARTPDNCVDLICTSIPFSNQYEYSPNYYDFGHTDDNDHFWGQMDFLTAELYRILKPGRDCIIHVKDRIVPGGINGFGFQTIHPFSDECSFHFRKHGFAQLGRRTISTDVVRENNQTYRLGWTEQCKDGSRMGHGMPEYEMLFRKPPTDRSNGYADEPVVKSKEAYTRSRWQFDAHGVWRSSGNRAIIPEDFAKLTYEQVYKLFKLHQLRDPYDFENDVAIAEFLDRKKMLPTIFQLLPVQSLSPWIWTDVVRMRSLNTVQAQRLLDNHICPLPTDLLNRWIKAHSNVGDVVLDPFAGIGSTPAEAVALDRIGWGWELSAKYFDDSIYHLKAAENKRRLPTLFDLAELESLEAEWVDLEMREAKVLGARAFDGAQEGAM